MEMLTTSPPAADPPADQSLPEVFRLREGITLHARDKSNQVVVEDAANGKFYRFGSVEGQFVAALMETGSATEAYQQCSESNPDFSAETAIKLCKWIVSSGWLEQTTRGAAASPRPPATNPLAAVFFWKIPLVNPDAALQRLVHYVGWLFSPHAMFIGLAIFLVGIIQMTGQWAEFVASYENLFTSWRWLSLAIAWLVLKIIHEIAHAATCRRYGGDVPSAGLAMILLMPIAFVNVTSSWRFASRWKRLHVTLAGVAAELAVGGIAMIAWTCCESLPIKQAAADIVLLATVSSLLFNLNPLLRFDGYFAVADLSGIDNLYTYGQSYARYFGGRYILGLEMSPPKLPGSRPGWIKFYGLSAAVYRVFTVSGMLFAAAAIFHGAGIIAAAAGACSFIFKPLLTLGKHLRKLHVDAGLSWSRLSFRLACLAMVTIAPLWIIPADWSFTSPAVVQYDPPAILRSRSAGFIETIHVHNGDTVVAGQPIVTIRNDELQMQLGSIRKELAQVQQEILAAQWHGAASELADAESRRDGLSQQQNELQSQVDSLVIYAPTDGTLISRQLALLPGAYIDSGREIAVVGREDSKRLKLSVSQTDAGHRDQWSEKPLRIVVAGQSAWTAPLTRLETRANLTPPDPSLLAINGGPLATMQNENGDPQLTDPRVSAYIALSPDRSRALRTGQRANVILGAHRQTVGNRLVSWVSSQVFD